MLTNYVPVNWQDLQLKVAEILQNCGFSVQVEQEFDTARGQVEIDVFAEENVKGRKYSIICECKFWKANIPQNVVHGVRTVVNDLGCNVGYIITTSDFQSGAFKTAGYSNVELLTWEKFQELFFDTWYEAYFIIQITKQLDPLLTYAEPLLPKWFDQMSPEDQEAYMALKEKYDLFGRVMMGFTTYVAFLGRKEKNKLPLSAGYNLPNDIYEHIPEPIMNETGYMEFLQKCLVYGMEAIARFRKFMDKYAAGLDNEYL